MGSGARRLEFGIRCLGGAEPRIEGAARMGLIHPLRGLYGYWWRDAESFHDTRRRDWMARIPGSRAGQANVVYEKWALERRYLGTWHSPLLLFADYNAGINRWYALGCSTITYVSVGFMLAWLTLKSDRLWPAALCFTPVCPHHFRQPDSQTLALPSGIQPNSALGLQLPIPLSHCTSGRAAERFSSSLQTT